MPTSEVEVKIGNFAKFQPGDKVVFLCDIVQKGTTQTGKIRRYSAARVGMTGTIKTVEGKYLTVDIDKKFSTHRSIISKVRPDWVAPVHEPVEIELPPKENSGATTWKGWSYEDLKALALEHGLTWRETKNERINIMWVVDALNKAGVKPPTAGVNPDEETG